VIAGGTEYGFHDIDNTTSPDPAVMRNNMPDRITVSQQSQRPAKNRHTPIEQIDDSAGKPRP